MARRRINIEIEDRYVEAIKTRYGVQTKTEAVDLALRHLAGQPMTREEALEMRGARAMGEVSDTAGMVAVTVRDVPDKVRDELAARAARQGKSLQDYLRSLLVHLDEKPTVDEVLARARVAAKGVRLDPAATVLAKDADRR